MRPAQAVMEDLAGSGLSAAQLALVIELSATVAAESRPIEDKSAQRRREKDRQYQAEKRRNRQSRQSRQISADAPSPNDIDILTPTLTPLGVSDETPPPPEIANQPELKPEHVLEVWNAKAPDWGLKPVRKFTPLRRRKVATRIRENTIDEFTEAISAIGRSSFLRGENDRGWRADFDWMLEPRNFTRLLEGNYDR